MEDLFFWNDISFCQECSSSVPELIQTKDDADFLHAEAILGSCHFFG